MKFLTGPDARRIGVTIPPALSAASALAGLTVPAALLALVWGAWVYFLLGRKQAAVNAAEIQAETCRKEVIHSQKLASIGQLSAGVAHEINTPLNIILQEAELISLMIDEDTPSAEDTAQIRESAQRIRGEARRCGDITHKMLDFSRKHVPVRQFADINRLAGDMITLVEREAGGRSVKVIRRFAADLPQIPTDPPLVRQILLNLLNNACQSVEKGGTITVTTYAEDGLVNAVVEDDGPGIGLEVQDKVFHPFFTTKPPGQGTGLGLSIGLRIARELGGEITLSSPPGKGAAFTLKLPATLEEVRQ